MTRTQMTVGHGRHIDFLMTEGNGDLIDATTTAMKFSILTNLLLPHFIQLAKNEGHATCMAVKLIS